MSFILDALRKSEQERQQSSVPIVSSMPRALSQPRLPRWAVGVMAVLSLALLVFGWAWWTERSSHGTALTTAVPANVTGNWLGPDVPTRGPAADVADPLPVAAAPTDAPAPAPMPPPADSISASSGSLRGSAITGAAAVNSAGTNPAATTRPANDVASRPEDTALPSRADLLGQGINIPTLDLQLHVYAPEPTRRLVFINGAKFTEGDTLPGGPTVVEITMDGVVLRQSGRDFLLPRS
jgi:general secretion pathway protein B